MAAGDNNGFTKPLSMGINLENGFFSEDGSSGFAVGAYAGRLNFSFWKKGEKSSENRDNKLSLNINQAMILNNCLQYIIQTRQSAYKQNGPESYQPINNLAINIEGFVNGQVTLFGVIRFDTVEIEGIKRVKLTVTRGNTVNTVVFCDLIQKGIVPTDSKVKFAYDTLDVSFLRFCTIVNSWLNFEWAQGGFNKIFNVMMGNRSNSGGSGNYNQNGGGQRRYGSEGSGDSDVVVDDMPF